MQYRFCLLLLAAACVPITPTQNSNGKTIEMADRTYEPLVKTVRIHPDYGVATDQIEPAVAELGKPNLLLEFDVLQSQNESLYLRIASCTYDWKPSSLHNLDFLDDYNAFPINDFKYSVDTQTPYVHYQIKLPSVKLAGNYIAIVYRASNPDDVLLTHRFMVYDNKVQVIRDGNLVGASQMTQRNQQINFRVLYTNLQVIDPIQSIHVVLRQNQRWDILATDLKPSFIHQDQNELEYHYYDEGGGMLSGDNEFRFFDLRSIRFPGQNVLRANTNVHPFEAFLDPDVSRNGLPYSEMKDLDGNYVINNIDYNGQSAENYINIHFELKTDPLPDAKVYVNGAFTSWRLGAENLMTYDSVAHCYRATILVKQGWYNYDYTVQSKTLPPNYFEGSHFQTENFYELFVYYHTFDRPMDLLVGYQSFTENKR